MTTPLTADDFKDKVDQTFEVDLTPDIEDDTTTLGLKLVECQDLTPHDFPGKARDPFSLFFQGPKSTFLAQGTYPLENKAMGKLEMFIVPIGESEDAYTYQAVFT